MAKLCPVDAFYIGFYLENQTIVFPYNYDGHEYVDPDVHTYGDDTLATWILNTKRPYRYREDNGRLLNRGISFGDETRISADTIAVPVFAPGTDTTVIGVASVQTYVSDTYTDEHLHAFEWTARSIATVLGRETEDDQNRRRLGADPTRQDPPTSLAEVIDEFSTKLGRLKLGIDAVTDVLPAQATEAQERLTDLKDQCERTQTEIMDMLTRPATDGNDLFKQLTPREREIAFHIAEGMTNLGIAELLHVTEPTVKTHVSRILHKFGVRQRSAVAAKLRPLR
jgi:DNA-binding CsgD family transcriptional regulator